MGPTASGKTQLGIELAKQINAQLISVDSAMVYRGLNIGTAKPNVQTLEKYPHALIDIRDPEDDYSVRDFFDDADQMVANALAEGKTPILLGGSMMYFSTFKNGLTELPSRDDAVRKRLDEQKEQIGLDAMHARLHKIDPLAALRIHPRNWVRIQRALEVYYITGQPLTRLWELHPKQEAERRHNCPLQEILLSEIPRATLHQRIADRLSAMFDDGLLDEVHTLRKRPQLHRNALSMQAVGYKQIWEYLDSQSALTVDQVKINVLQATRQLARRQLVWLRRWKHIADKNRLSHDPPTQQVLKLLQ